MKYELKRSNSFKRDYKRIMKQGFDVSLLKIVVDKIQNGEVLEKKYCDHGLHGEWEGFRECHIKPDWLLIYLIEDDILTLTLTRTGSHTELFDKSK